jgi:hypothetical protein
MWEAVRSIPMGENVQSEREISVPLNPDLQFRPKRIPANGAGDMSPYQALYKRPESFEVRG